MRRRIVEKDLEEVYQRDIPWERLEGKTVLVTGAYGMLASYVVYMLLYLIEKAGMHIQVIAAVRSEEKLRERFLEFTRRSYFKVYKSEMDAPLCHQRGHSLYYPCRKPGVAAVLQSMPGGSAKAEHGRELLPAGACRPKKRGGLPFFQLRGHIWRSGRKSLHK